MKKWMNMHFVMFAILIASVTHAKTPLSKVFCSEWAFRVQNGMPVHETDEAWADFTMRLEAKIARDVHGNAFQECLSAYREELDRGEFLLDGKRMLERLVDESVESPTIASDPRLASVNLPGFGEVEIQPQAQTRRGLAPEVQRATQRSEHYDGLWRAFLQELRKTMTGQRQALRMGLKGR